MNDQILTFAGIMIGFVPALAFLFIMLYKYEGCFDDRKLFITFAGGMFLGMIAASFEMLQFFDMNPETAQYLGFCILSIIGIAFFNEALKTMVLNMKRFQGKFDTTFYGSSLGLGFGAMYSFIVVARMFNLSDYISTFLDVIVVVGIILLHASLGTLIGYGCSIKRPIKYFGYATLIHLLLNTIIFTTYLGMPYSFFVVFTIIYGASWFYYVIVYILPKSLPEKMRKQKRRILRKV
ncbi:MAG: hypothetical protein KKE04_01540 [Candidatus Thermoplasmatota archaeon]|nr:hypothetical protein [Candidatus Thermoplasmatota archaeon]